ncbi:hypothetical protein BJ944DRAFT_244504 [Cunninghamella echinulata]|nr:hypothetical protein BJ944DRAFT_244504 [Cunninghamella echinulata]
MNSVHNNSNNSTANNNKEWQPALQSPSLTDPPSTPSQPIFPPTPLEHGYTPNFPPNQIESPIHQHFPSHSQPSNYFTSPIKQDTDPRLPGMMGMLSQPSTPRPTENEPLSPNSNKKIVNYNNFNTAPYPTGLPVRKQRGSRSDTSIFTAEMGPIFSSTKSLENIYGLDRNTLLNVRIQAKMDRGFFLADNDWTCYRRNYFQVSCAFSISGLNSPNPYYDPHHPHHHHPHHHYEPQCYIQLDGMFIPVRQFSLNISARVSNSDKKIDLVQHTPKRDKGPQNTPVPKPVLPGGNVNLSAVGANQNIATFERIQFKTATANNGKRRAAQQYYVCIVDLYCDVVTENGLHRQIKIATCQSAPLVVRGRSPGHYSDNNQLQTSNPSSASSLQQPPPLSHLPPTTNRLLNHPPLPPPNNNNNPNNNLMTQPPPPSLTAMNNHNNNNSTNNGRYEMSGYPLPSPHLEDPRFAPPSPTYMTRPPPNNNSNNNNNNSNNTNGNPDYYYTPNYHNNGYHHHPPPPPPLTYMQQQHSQGHHPHHSNHHPIMNHSLPPPQTTNYNDSHPYMVPSMHPHHPSATPTPSTTTSNNTNTTTTPSSAPNTPNDIYQQHSSNATNTASSNNNDHPPSSSVDPKSIVNSQHQNVGSPAHTPTGYDQASYFHPPQPTQK